MRLTAGEAGGLAIAVIGLVAAGAALALRAPARTDAPAMAAQPVAEVIPAKLAPERAQPQPALVIKRILPIAGPIRYGEWHWDDAGVPAGPLVITVDLEARVLSVFRGGYEIAATAVLLGTDEKPTPLGVFPISQKDATHVSNLYHAPMPYMLRLTGDGVTIHGTHVQLGYASHGCIGVPTPFAKKLFGITHIGDRVIVTRGKQSKLGDALVEG
ncbi:MAG: L,D-transpeptidase family protein [Novosphingobium sp.]|nr:L,D-transpeptidase family protein [Novosphingobium sp.]